MPRRAELQGRRRPWRLQRAGAARASGDTVQKTSRGGRGGSTRFERLNKEGVRGAGLGLAIASRIVELHGGRIWVEDNPEGGSVFLTALRKAPDVS